MKKRIALLISITCFQGFPQSSESNHGYFISPGLKIGYSFGKTKGLTLGFEISGGFVSEGFILGPVIGSQYLFTSHSIINYMELELGTFIGGVSMGAEFAEKQVNSRIRLFGGFFGYLAYSYTGGIQRHEIDAVGKLPIVVSGQAFRI